MNGAWYISLLESYPDVVTVVRSLQDGIPGTLGDTLVGLYLTGSLS
jgi:hypothetical protein